MVQAWYLKDEGNDQRDPPEVSELITAQYLFKKTGVEYIKLNPETYATDGVIDKIKADRRYVYEDNLVLSKERPGFEDNITSFKIEHLHRDEEIRFVTDGKGYFDVRDAEDQWIRIQVTAGDMLVLPGGIYHRFSLCPKKNYITLKRLFTKRPEWCSYDRPADEMQCRKEYIEQLAKGFAPAS